MPETTPVLAIPLQAIGKSNEHVAFSGTLQPVVRDNCRLLIELGESVLRAGVCWLILLNSHDGQSQVMDIVARELRIRYTMLVVNAAWFDMGTPDNLFSANKCRHGIHGGEIETSLMLHLRPDLVDMTRVLDFVKEFELLAVEGRFGWQATDLNRWGVCGNAAAADAERGA